MSTFNARSVVVSACALILCVSYPAAAQDLSRYRNIAFGSSLSSVIAITGTNPSAVKVIHQRPALIQELAWRPQYSVIRPVDDIEAVKEVTLGFADDELFRVTVVYDARLVEGLTDADIISAVSTVYGPATLTAAASKGPAVVPPGMSNASTAIARWQTSAYEFTLMREVYPATFRLIGVSTRRKRRGARRNGLRPMRSARKQPRTRHERPTRAASAREAVPLKKR